MTTVVKCPRCKQDKPEAEFSGFKTCDRCRAYYRQRHADGKSWKAKNPDAVRAHGREHYTQNREACAARSRKWRSENHDRMLETLRRYRETHRDEMVASSRRWYAANRERNIAAVLAWRERNADHFREYMRDLSKTLYWRNPDKGRADSRARSATRRARIVQTSVAPFTTDELLQRMSMFPACWICKEAPWSHIDHVKPLAKGGAHILANLRPACEACNLSKGSQWPFVPPERNTRNATLL